MYMHAKSDTNNTLDSIRTLTYRIGQVSFKKAELSPICAGVIIDLMHGLSLMAGKWTT